MHWFWSVMLAAMIVGASAPRPAMAAGVTIEHVSALVWHDGRQHRLILQLVATEVSTAAIVLTLPAGATIALLEPTMTLEPLEAVTAPIDDVRHELIWDRRPLTPLPLMDPQPPGAATRLTVQRDSRATTGYVQLARAGRSTPIGIAMPGDIATVLRWLGTQFAGASLNLVLALEPPMAISGTAPVFVGPADELPNSPALTSLPGSPLVVRHQLTLIGPLLATALTDQTPMRLRRQRVVQVDGWRRMALPILGVAAVLVASVMAFSVSLVIRRRIDMLGERR